MMYLLIGWGICAVIVIGILLWAADHAPIRNDWD